MSGHSKWANIRVKKTAQDTKRGKVFTRHARLIEMAVREGGGGDPMMNTKLATAIENVKVDNVPNDNIQRAIKKGTGELKGEQMTEILYAAYGPGSVALLIECLTDNRNRTIGNVRTSIEKHGGKWAESGSVLFLFDRKGIVIARGNLTDELELLLIDAGAEDTERGDGIITVTTEKTNWAVIRDVLKNAGLQIQEAGIKYVPHQTVSVTDMDTAKKLLEMVEAIEEDDDVSEVHTNAEIDEAIVGKL